MAVNFKRKNKKCIEIVDKDNKVIAPLGHDPVSYDRVSFRIMSANYIIKFKLLVFLRKTEIFKD